MIRQYSCFRSPTQLFYTDSIVSAGSHVRFCRLKIFSLNKTWPQNNPLPLALSSGNSDCSIDRGQPRHARPRKAVLCPCSAFGRMTNIPNPLFCLFVLHAISKFRHSFKNRMKHGSISWLIQSRLAFLYSIHTVLVS